MPLSSSTLGTLIKTKITGKLGTPDDAEQLKKFCDAVAEAVVEHIKSEAVVNVTSVSGVVAGPAASGPGLGTIT